MEQGKVTVSCSVLKRRFAQAETRGKQSTILQKASRSTLLVLLLLLALVLPLRAQSHAGAFPYSPRVKQDLNTLLFSGNLNEHLLRSTPTNLLSSDPYTPTSLACSINTACAEGDGWHDAINAVVKISNGCNGVLINNTREDEMPYVLTVHHCGEPAVGDPVDWVFEFNYQSDTCADPAETPIPQTIQGATVVAAQPSPHDFVLLQLSEPIPAEYGVFHAGWSLDEVTPTSGVVIGHPSQDIKKITIDDDPLTNVVGYWLATFDHGTIEGGSSGSPLFNENHQVIGLTRGAIQIDHNACSGPGGDDNGATIIVPKLASIWNVGNPGERLSDFLDPDATGAPDLTALQGTGQLLPVELTAFEAQLDGDAVLLHWQTASETNNAGFEVQHQNRNNESPWTVLDWVEGHGTTEHAQAYHYRVDDLTPGRHVFRLKQIDFDGTFEYHPEVAVIVEMVERFVVESVYPNPFNPAAEFGFAVQRAQRVEVGLYDVLGREVGVLYGGWVEAGQLQRVRIDGSALPSGQYLVRVMGKTFVKTQMVTLLK